MCSGNALIYFRGVEWKHGWCINKQKLNDLVQFKRKYVHINRNFCLYLHTQVI